MKFLNVAGTVTLTARTWMTNVMRLRIAQIIAFVLKVSPEITAGFAYRKRNVKAIFLYSF